MSEQLLSLSKHGNFGLQELSLIPGNAALLTPRMPYDTVIFLDEGRYLSTQSAPGGQSLCFSSPYNAWHCAWHLISSIFAAAAAADMAAQGVLVKGER